VFSTNNRIRRYRQDWLEHVERMEGGRVPKQALWYRPRGRRDPGRPRRRWNSYKPEQANGLILELEKKKKKKKCSSLVNLLLLLNKIFEQMLIV
jgi:hypothetical protein